jgi:GT2 family glycosyltransferase
MLLSVVIVNWNSKDDLSACLQSLEQQTHQELEVIVVDNGSEDGSIEHVRARFPSVHLIEAGENLGFAEGCNRGIAEAHGPWIALLNNDAVADARWAEELVRAAEKADPRCGMLQSVMYFLDKPDVINSMGLFITRSGGGIDRREGEKREHAARENIFCPTGGAAAYRRAMLDEVRLPVGWLDREYFMYAEDLDLGWRAQLAGWTAELVPDSWVLHKFHGSTVRRGRAWFVVMTRTNRLRTLLKNASPAFLALTVPYTFLEMVELAWHGGWPAVRALPTAVRQSLRQRANIAQRATVDRRSIEQRWVDRR